MVALLAEGVDRNIVGLMCYIQCSLSPSSRRAWIEISGEGFARMMRRVALLAEGVDRNKYPVAKATRPLGRPPRGGRG